MARPAGFEPATYGLEGRCTIRLCYERLGRQYAIADQPAQVANADILQDPGVWSRLGFHEQ